MVNKSDQPQRAAIDEAEKAFSKKAVRVSALTGENIAALEDAIWRSVFDGGRVLEEGAVISNARHIGLLKSSRASLETAGDSLRRGLSLEFAALDIKKALDALGELTGEVLSDGLLDAIFSKFCIGK